MKTPGPTGGDPPHFGNRTRKPAQPRPKAISPSRVSGILSRAMPNLGIETKIREYNLKKLWPEIVGEAIAKRAVPSRLVGKTLYCTVSTSAWMTELSYQKKVMVEKINRRLGCPAVEDLVLRHGSVPTPAAPRKDKSERTLTPEERRFIESTASGVKDESLRSLIKRVIKKAKS